jgi:hypothetical protein
MGRGIVSYDAGVRVGDGGRGEGVEWEMAGRIGEIEGARHKGMKVRF